MQCFERLSPWLIQLPWNYANTRKRLFCFSSFFELGEAKSSLFWMRIWQRCRIVSPLVKWANTTRERWVTADFTRIQLYWMLSPKNTWVNQNFFIIKVFRTIVFIFIISTTFRPICPPAFFRCLSNSGTFTELRTTSFIETTGVACSDFVCHDRVQVLSIHGKRNQNRRPPWFQ